MVVGTTVVTVLVMVLVRTYVVPGAVMVSVVGQTVVYVISTSVVVPCVTVGPGTVTTPPSQPWHSVMVMVDVVSFVTTTVL